MSQLASILLSFTLLKQVFMIAAVVSDPSFFADVRENVHMRQEIGNESKRPILARVPYAMQNNLCLPPIR